MPNNIIPQGDDQEWKLAVDRLLEKLEADIERIRELLKASN